MMSTLRAEEVMQVAPMRCRLIGHVRHVAADRFSLEIDPDSRIVFRCDWPSRIDIAFSPDSPISSTGDLRGGELVSCVVLDSASTPMTARVTRCGR